MSPQVVGLIVFAALMLLLAVFMWPASRRMNGSQKYRRNRRPGPDLDPETNKRASMSPVQIALATLLGHGAASSADASDGGGTDAGDVGDGGGGDGGGD